MSKTNLVIRQLCECVQNNRVKRLTIQGLDFSREVTLSLLEVVQDLFIYGNVKNTFADHFFSALDQNTSLIQLSIEQCSLVEEETRHLFEILGRKKNFLHLNLKHTEKDCTNETMETMIRMNDTPLWCEWSFEDVVEKCWCGKEKSKWTHCVVCQERKFLSNQFVSLLNPFLFIKDLSFLVVSFLGMDVIEVNPNTIVDFLCQGKPCTIFSFGFVSPVEDEDEDDDIFKNHLHLASN